MTFFQIVAAVHARGSFIYLQIRGMGRAADAGELAARGLSFVAPSAIPIMGRPTPRALTIPEIHAYIAWFTTAAQNAVEQAGFDGVELHFANGYLADQFIQDVTNQRTDEYGGSVAARSRFALEVIDAVTAAIGAERTGVRLSPWSVFLGAYFCPRPTRAMLIICRYGDERSLAAVHAYRPGAQGPAPGPRLPPPYRAGCRWCGRCGRDARHRTSVE